MESIAKVLKCSSAHDTVTLKAEDEGETLNLVFENGEADRISDFEIKLVDLDVEHLEIPEEEAQAVITMGASEFQRICRDLSTLGDACAIAVTKEGIRFSVSGDVGKGSVMLRPHDSVEGNAGVHIYMREVIEQRFALRYLCMFTKATPLANNVKLSLMVDMPMKIEYEVEGVGSLCFYLAPKMDDEE